MVTITIYKPVYGTFVYIRDSYIKEAKRKNVPLHIIIPGIADSIISVSDWLKDAKILFKEFKIPGHPMKLYGNHVPIRDGDPTTHLHSKEE